MKRTFTLFVILYVLLIISCKREQNHTNALPSNWASYRPETIPFRVRQQNFERGNLIPNSSFESGRLYEIENDQEPFNTPGWGRSGEHVYWVNISNPQFDSSEVSTGNHAIKIVKEKSDETKDVGEGVVSDFIKVIPGRYLLSLDVKLQNIRSSKSRLGTKLYDAIDIRLIYFDKNKIEISPNQYSSYYQTNINTSNKWLSFGHFNEIDSFGWSTVFCESAYPPFPDGYVPNETRFIKVFIGLKGSGTMWVDNISYRYTKDNFALQERLEPLFLKEFDAYDMILPTPQKIIKKNKIELASDSLNNGVLVIYPKYSMISKSLEFSELMNKISKYNTKLSNSISLRELGQFKLIFSIGNTEIFNKTFHDSIFRQIEKNDNQGYIIRMVENFPNIVFISSGSEQGLRYGISTTAQLVDTSKNIFSSADITDWPELQTRTVTINSKINEGNFDDLISQLRFTTVFSKDLKENAFNNNKNGLIIDEAFLYEVRPGTDLQDRPLLLKTKTIPEQIKLTLNKTLWFYPEFSQLEKLDQMDNENKFIINSMEKLGFNGVVWKGTSEYSPYIDELDYHRIKEYFNVPVVLSLSLDNNPYEIPVGANNLLSQPNYKISGTIFDKIEHLNLEIDSLNLVSKLKLISMSCYGWNTKDYNSDEILYKVLNKSITHEGDILKLISLSDKFKYLQWQNQMKGKQDDMMEYVEFKELVEDYRFEDGNLDSVILNNIKTVLGVNQSY